MQSTQLTKESCRNYIQEHLLIPPLTGNNKLHNNVGNIGVELEVFPYTFDKQQRVHPVRLYGGEHSLIKAIISESEKQHGVVQYLDQEINGEQHEPLVAAIRFADGSNINFEPGSQTEISTAPCNSISELHDQLTGKQQLLDAVTKNHGFHFAQYGTHPWCTVNSIGMQMNKTRYRAMANYFNNIGDYGIMMMLQTCSLQVNLDMGADHDTKVKRIVAANLLAPFSTALFANSPVTAGKVNGHQSYRSYIWQQLDPTRTGLLPVHQLSGVTDQEGIIDAYLQFALKAPLIFIEEFGEEMFPSQVTMEYWLKHPVKGLLPTLKHFKNHLSLLFPEVRWKGYLELRSVDAPPREWQLVPLMFYCGLLYNDYALNKVLDLLLPVAVQLPQLMQEATHGLQSNRLYFITQHLMRLAIDGYTLLPRLFNDTSIQQLISFNETYTEHRKTFADELLDKFLAGKISFS